MTDISYLVQDEDPNSEDFETVFEVLGVRSDYLAATVYLRNCRTDEVHIMTPRAMMVSRMFRALPLDQVSQDRKDVRTVPASAELRTSVAQAVSTIKNHELAEMCGISDTEMANAMRGVASLPHLKPLENHAQVVTRLAGASTERQLGRAQELIRQLLDVVASVPALHLRESGVYVGAGDTVSRARMLLAELEQ